LANSLTDAGATVSWTSNEVSSGQIAYGLTDAYGSFSAVTNLVTQHVQDLVGLAADTFYHYCVMSIDAAGNLTTSTDYTFSTLAMPDTTAPTLLSISSDTPTHDGATITWTTDEASDTQVQYGTTTNYGSSSDLDTNSVTDHSVSLSGLTANTLYHYRVESRDAAGNLIASEDRTFMTAMAPDVTPPVLSAISSDTPTHDGATIIWTTDEASDTQVQYGTTTNYGKLQ